MVAIIIVIIIIIQIYLKGEYFDVHGARRQ